MSNRSVLIRVPSTVGNFGGAVNCAALALEASLNVKVTPRIDGHMGIRYFGDSGERVPRDRANLVVRAMEAALHLKGLEFTGADFEIFSSVPVSVGLGSSTAAVLAGLIAADRLFRLKLDEKTIFDLAAIYESRGENLRAAWYGGFVVCAEEQGTVAYQRTVVPENLALNVIVPETTVSFSERQPRAGARLPSDRSAHFRRASTFAEFFARAGSDGALEIEAPLPPTCEKVVPGLEEALKIQKPGVLAVFVCGTGPAVAVLHHGSHEETAEAVAAVRECFAQHGTVTRLAEFRPTNAGAREWNSVHPDITLPLKKGLSVPLQKSAGLPV